MLGLKFRKAHKFFQPLEVVDRGSETHFQVGVQFKLNTSVLSHVIILESKVITCVQGLDRIVFFVGQL